MYVLTLQDVLTDAKTIKRQAAGQGSFWTLEQCVESVCENSSTLVDPNIKAEALKQAKELDAIEQEKFDIVVIQDNSMWPLEHADSVLMYGKLFCDLIKSKNSTPYIYNTWSRKATPQTQSTINKVYESLAVQTQSVLVPVGSVWAEVKIQKPNVELYMSDESHPSWHGTFITALCFVKK
jgi:hypothetical protein